MSNPQTGAELRPAIRDLLPTIGASATTAEFANRVGSTVSDTYRALAALEGDGAVSRGFGSPGIAGIRWRPAAAGAAR